MGEKQVSKAGSAADIQETENRIMKWLAVKVDRGRYAHSLRVMELIPQLAEAHGVAPMPLRLAALLHDSARGMSDEEMLAAAERWKVAVRPLDRDCPVLLHGRLAVELARRELGVNEPAVVTAVLYHTAGHPRMSLSDKLLFLADMIEPARRIERVDELRSVSFRDVDRAMLLAIAINRRHLAARGRPMDPVTLELEQALTS